MFVFCVYLGSGSSGEKRQAPKKQTNKKTQPNKQKNQKPKPKRPQIFVGGWFTTKMIACWDEFSQVCNWRNLIIYILTLDVRNDSLASY